MGIFLYTIHVFTSLFLILVVLLQQGKGADLSVFGGGATMTAFGARGAASLLHRLTVGGFVVFILTTLAIGVYQGKTGESVMVGVPETEEVATDLAATPETEAPEGEEATAPAGGVLPEAEGVLPEAADPTLAPDEEGAASEPEDEGGG